MINQLSSFENFAQSRRNLARKHLTTYIFGFADAMEFVGAVLGPAQT